MAGRVTLSDLRGILEQIRVDRPLVEEAVRLAETVEQSDVVTRIFINLERRTPPASFRPYGPRLVPTFNYFQTAACLYQEGALDEGGVATVVRSLFEDSAYSAERLVNSLADIERRGHLRRETALLLTELLRREGVLPGDVGIRARLSTRWARLRTAFRAAAEEPIGTTLIDYAALVGGDPGLRDETEPEGGAA
jgi:hypothetical protein